MSKLLRTYFALAASLVSIYGFIALLAFGGIPPYHSVFPPPIAVTGFLFGGLVGSIGGGIFHAGLFLALNLYVLRRASKRASFKPLRAFMPSLVVLFIVIGLSLWYWLASLSYGLKYQGLLYVAIYGTLDILTLGVLTAVPFRITHRAFKNERAISASIVMAYNFCIHAAILLVLFPYLGETP